MCVAFARRRAGSAADDLTIVRALGRLLSIVTDDPMLGDWDLVEALGLGWIRPQTCDPRGRLCSDCLRKELGDRTGFVFSPMYEVRGRTQRTRKPLPLAGVQEYVIASRTAQELDSNDPGLRALAFRGAEMDAVRKWSSGAMGRSTSSTSRTYWSHTTSSSQPGSSARSAARRAPDRATCLNGGQVRGWPILDRDARWGGSRSGCPLEMGVAR